MSHEILSAKLYELDREFGLLHGSIQLSETASREQLGQELARLRQKNEASAEEALLLAEYSLDFAAQAANHALLLSLEAVSAQDIPRGKETEVEQNEASL